MGPVWPRRQRRGFALLSTIIALLIAAVVLDRVVATVATDRNEATAAATFTVVRSIAEAAAVLDNDPLTTGVLPHLPARRDLEFTYTENPAAPDEMRFDWSGLPPRSAVVLENRLAEWLSRERVSGPLVLALRRCSPPLPPPRAAGRSLHADGPDHDGDPGNRRVECSHRHMG